jgi:flagellar biosynthetic protein FlhB
MAAEDRTEEPTGKRITEARKRGQVAQSRELNTAILLLLGGVLLGGPGVSLLAKMTELLVGSIIDLPTSLPNLTWLRQMLFMDAITILPYLGLIVVGLLFTGVTVTLAQTGFLWASEKLGFDFDRINPINGFKRLLSLQGFVELLRSLLKLMVVGWVAYSFLKNHVLSLIGLGQVDMNTALQNWAGMALTLISQVAMAYMVLAIIDYSYQRWQTKKSLKMTKEEVKEEYKQTEGNPQIKSAIRSKQRRIAMRRMMANVPKADVVITNPTHLAIAIQYKPGEMNAPVVLAKGAYKIAERIVDVARDYDLPVIQNIPLARGLYRVVEIDEEIPSEFYVAMAEILAYVYRLKDKKL